MLVVARSNVVSDQIGGHDELKSNDVSTCVQDVKVVSSSVKPCWSSVVVFQESAEVVYVDSVCSGNI